MTPRVAVLIPCYNEAVAIEGVIAGFRELPHHDDLTAAYMPGYYATLAVKPATG